MSLRANEIDVHVGGRMRRRREALGLTQGRLGRHLGLTFSQIQKYEKGSNRIGAGRLYQIASYLGVTPSHFFEGLDETPGSGAVDVVATAEPMREEVAQLTRAYCAIPDPERRAMVLALVRSLVPVTGPLSGNDDAAR